MKLLLLAGTAEARVLAGRLAGDPRFEAVASLAGATRHPEALPVPTRVGGFGGREAQNKWMQNNGICVVIDATHPFATHISQRTQAICAAAGLPYLRLQRPGWQARPGDRWTRVPDLSAAAKALAPGATAFLATGRSSLGAFATRPDVTLHLRVVDPPEAPFAHPKGGYVVGKPAAIQSEEERLFKALGIDVVVTKNAGGAAVAKLDAARALALPVIMVDRPALSVPPRAQVESVEAALDWLERQL